MDMCMKKSIKIAGSYPNQKFLNNPIIYNSIMKNVTQSKIAL